MFKDKRSKRIIILAHCILNQNTKLDRLVGNYPGTVTEIADIIIKSGAGILQMPCPELLYMGLDRQYQAGKQPSIESERDRIRNKMSDEEGRKLCSKLAEQVIIQIEDYQKNDFKVLGIIGVNPSPTCGVETTWDNGQVIKGKGCFMQIITEELNKKGLIVPFIGIEPDQIQKNLDTVRKLLS